MKRSDDENAICAMCEHSVLIKESDMCICDLEGAVRCDGSCRRFTQDLLKLDPRPRKLPDGDETVFVDV